MFRSSFYLHIVALRWLLAIALLLWLAAFFFVANPLRPYAPTLFGMTKIAPGLYTDDPAYGDYIMDAVTKGDDLAAEFFGTLEARPWMIVCTTAACDQTFSAQGKAYAYRDRFILVGHNGIHASVLAHELVHAELYLTFRDRQNGPHALPAWLNEGLATFVSGDDRATQFVANDALWVLEAQELSDWHQLVHDNSWQDTYGAAQSVVLGLNDVLGREGLVNLIASFQSGDASSTTVKGTIDRLPL